MKTLFLVRHAKSSWKYKDLSDLERPLNSRGRRDAPFMGKLLNRQKIRPDIILASPAVRAVSTVKFFCEGMDIPFEEVKIFSRLYMPDPEEILQIIGDLENSVNTAMIFSHNPGITDLYNLISDSYIDNIPTCGVAGIEFPEESWEGLTEKKGQLMLFEYPKKYFSDKN